MGRLGEVAFREVINAARYFVRSGYGRDMSQIHFGYWRTACARFQLMDKEVSLNFVAKIIRGRDRAKSIGVCPVVGS